MLLNILLCLLMLWTAHQASAKAAAGNNGKGKSDKVVNREQQFDSFTQDVLRPWFAKYPDEWIGALPAGDLAVHLRYKSFLNPGNKANLIIVHGYGERIEKYQELIFDFSQQHYNVFIFDQRGFGRSTWLNDDGRAVFVHSFDDYVLDAINFVENIVNKRAPGLPNFIFAHSMGGAVTTLAIKKSPAIAKAVILSAPMLDIKTNPLPQPLALVFSRLMVSMGKSRQYVFGQGEAQPSGFEMAHTSSFSRWQYFDRFIRQAQEWQTVVGGASFQWLVESLAMTQRVQEKDFAASIQTPILLFQAEQDSLVNPEGQNLFCLQAKHCQKEIIKGARHEIYRESDSMRDPYFKMILDFLQTQAYQK